LGNFLIGLREGLEASLIVGILIAYLVKTGRGQHVRKVWLGVAVAVVTSLGFGALLTFGPSGLSDRAQEMIAGTLSIFAVALVTWMIFWMAKAGQGLAARLQHQTDQTNAAAWSLAVIAAVAVGREGLETALFVWAATTSLTAGGGASTEPLLGALAGLATAAVLGYLIYAGALRVNLRRFFTITGGFLIVVAAGVLAYGVHELQEAGVLPGLDAVAYDISAIISPGGLSGSLLKGVFNFTAAPTWGQVISWFTYVVIVAVAFTLRTRQSGGRNAAVKANVRPPVVVSGKESSLT